MLMNKDGSSLTQLTHFREPGHPHSVLNPKKGIAACAGRSRDGRPVQSEHSGLSKIRVLGPDIRRPEPLMKFRVCSQRHRRSALLKKREISRADTPVCPFRVCEGRVVLNQIRQFVERRAYRLAASRRRRIGLYAGSMLAVPSAFSGRGQRYLAVLRIGEPAPLSPCPLDESAISPGRPARETPHELPGHRL